MMRMTFEMLAFRVPGSLILSEILLMRPVFSSALLAIEVSWPLPTKPRFGASVGAQRALRILVLLLNAVPVSSFLLSASLVMRGVSP